jgi:hypothetical protein
LVILSFNEMEFVKSLVIIKVMVLFFSDLFYFITF